MTEILQNLELTPFILSFKLAGVTTFILFLIAMPLAWYLAFTKSKIKPYLEALSALPIVLPPSVLGFYMLILLSSDSFFGHFVEQTFGVQLLFSFSGLVVASCFYSLPFMVQPLQSGFESLNYAMLEASYLSGKSKLQTLLRVALPNMKPALLSALVITFAHTVGEFGVVLMVGGSLPDETRVASVALYEMVEQMEYEQAHIYSAIMIGMSFLVLLTLYIFNASSRKKIGA